MSKDSKNNQHTTQDGSEEYTQLAPRVTPKVQSRIQPKVQSKIQPRSLVPSGKETQTETSTKDQLPEEVQAKMENSFRQDFSNVTIHKDSSSAENINAKAYTQGTDIHFAPGEYNPTSKNGQELIGHELTHVVQQGQGKVGSGEIHGKGLEINQDTGLEKEADDAGKLASEGKSVEVMGNSMNSVQLKTEEVLGNDNDLKNDFENKLSIYLLDLKGQMQDFVNDFTLVGEEGSNEVKSSVLDFAFNAFGIGDQYAAVLQIVNIIKNGLEGVIEGKEKMPLTDFVDSISKGLSFIKENNMDSAFANFNSYCSINGYSNNEQKAGQLNSFISLLPDVHDFRKNLVIGWIKSSSDSMWDRDDGTATAGYIYLRITYQGPFYPLGKKVGNDQWMKSECFIDDVEMPTGTNNALKHAYNENLELIKLPLDIQVDISCGVNEGKYVNDVFKQVKYERKNGSWIKIYGNETMFKDWLAQNKLKIKDLEID